MSEPAPMPRIGDRVRVRDVPYVLPAWVGRRGVVTALHEGELPVEAEISGLPRPEWFWPGEVEIEGEEGHAI